MKNTIELDHKVLQKNLELTKALQTMDRLLAENIDLKEQLNTAIDTATWTKSANKQKDEIIDELNVKLDNYAEEIVRLSCIETDYDNAEDILGKEHYESLRKFVKHYIQEVNWDKINELEKRK